MQLPDPEYLKQLRDSLACTCGCGTNQTSDEFVNFLYMAESAAGLRFTITSGFRCKKHNQEVPGHDDDSAALYGEHADLAYGDTGTGFLILKALIAAGFERVRVYSLLDAYNHKKKTAHIHVDRHPKHHYPALTVGTY